MSTPEVSHGAVSEASVPQTLPSTEADKSFVKDWMGIMDPFLRDRRFDRKPIVPRVTYSWTLTTPELWPIPYEVSLDVEKTAEFFRSSGMTNSDIKYTKVHVTDEPRDGGIGSLGIHNIGVGGSYSRAKNRISLYANKVWKERERHQKKAEKKLDSTEKTDGSMATTIFERIRYPWLKDIPQTATAEDVERIISEKANRRISNFFLQQASKAIDANLPATSKKYAAYATSTWFLREAVFLGTAVPVYVGLRTSGFWNFVGSAGAAVVVGNAARAVTGRLGRVISPVERRSRKFANQHLDAYADIVKITPRVSSQTQTT